MSLEPCPNVSCQLLPANPCSWKASDSRHHQESPQDSFEPFLGKGFLVPFIRDLKVPHSPLPKQVPHTASQGGDHENRTILWFYTLTVAASDNRERTGRFSLRRERSVRKLCCQRRCDPESRFSECKLWKRLMPVFGNTLRAELPRGLDANRETAGTRQRRLSARPSGRSRASVSAMKFRVAA